jgi:hypothetical protein
MIKTRTQLHNNPFLWLLVLGLALAFILTGGPKAVGAALISYNSFDTATKQKVDNTRAFAANADAGQAIVKQGGPITDNGTVLDGIDLTGFSGTFIATVSGQVDRTLAAPVAGKQVQPQLSLWRDCDNDGIFEWKTGEGAMSPNATIPDAKDRSVTINGSVKYSVYKACHTKLIAFAYAADGSGYAGEPELSVGWASVTLIPIR